MNKKGFTLIELLAVVVILSLLVIIVASTILSTMYDAKKSALRTYAGRVMEKARTNCMSTITILGGGPNDHPKECGTKSNPLNLSSIMGTEASSTYTASIYITFENGDYVAHGTVKDNSKNRVCIKNGKVTSPEVNITSDCFDV